MSIAQPSANGVLIRLREETREVHQQLEQSLGLVTPNLTRHAYQATLERFYSFYLAFEAEVWPKLPAFWAALFADRRKTPLLEEDLRSLDSRLEGICVCRHLIPYASLAEILGALYVTEGSTLGGQLISRHVQQQLGLTAHTGLRFFLSYGAKVGSHWKHFTESLQAETSVSDSDQIIQGATQTFKCIAQCLTEG